MVITSPERDLRSVYVFMFQCEVNVMCQLVTKPICRTCGKGVLAKGSNTTNLFQHLREHHPQIYANLAPLASKVKSSSESEANTKQPTLSESIARSAKYLPDSAQAKELNRAVTYYIAKDSMPISVVERPGFKHMLLKLNPRYQVPARRHFTDYEIPQLYSHVKDNIVAKSLKEVTFFAATTDLWSSDSCHPYLTLTVHFVSSNWDLKSFCLDTAALYEDHTGQNIADAISDIFDNWNLDMKKLVATTTDNASNMIAAFNLLDLLRLSCFGHNLDLAINKGLDCAQVRRALARCHSLVELFHRSWKKARDLREKQQTLGLPEHKILGDVVTRWGSTYLMISRILEQQQALSAVLAEDRKNWHRMPTDPELSVLETIHDILKPLSFLTDALAGEKEVTASVVLPVLKHIKKKLAVDYDKDSTLAKGVKETIWSDLESRYMETGVSEVLDFASFLDPRFKDKEQYLHGKDEIIQQITDQCLQYYPTVNDIDTNDASTSDVEEVHPAKQMKGLTAVLQHIAEDDNVHSVTPLTPLQKIKKEVTSYLDYPSLAPDTNPLEWWKAENGKFPNLAYLAKKYLCSMPSERVAAVLGISLTT